MEDTSDKIASDAFPSSAEDEGSGREYQSIIADKVLGSNQRPGTRHHIRYDERVCSRPCCKNLDELSAITTKTSSDYCSRCIGSLVCCFGDLKIECWRESQKTLIVPTICLIMEICVCLVFIVTWHSHTDESSFHIDHEVVEYFLVGYMALGLFGMLFCYFKRKDEQFVIFTENEDQASHYLISGVYAFGGGSLFIIVLSLFAYAHCFESASNIVFNIWRFCFTLCQMLFLQRFSLATFRRNALVIFLLFHMLGTNICIWVFFVVEETQLLPKADDSSHIKCSKSSNVTETMNDWQEYMTPFTMEFCIICAGLTYAMVSSMKNFPTNKKEDLFKRTEPKDGCLSNAERKHYPGRNKFASLELASEQMYSDDAPDSITETATSPPCSIIQEGVERKDQESNVSETYPGFLFGLAVAVVMAVSELVVKEQHDFARSLLFHHIFIMVVSLTQVAALVVIIRCLKNRKRVRRSFRSDDTLLMISFVGISLWNLFCMLATASGLGSQNKQRDLHDLFDLKSSVAAAIFVDNLSNVIETTLQVCVVIRTLRFKNVLLSKEGDSFRRMHRLRQALVYLLMTNIGFWVLDSFFEIRYSGIYYPVADDFFIDHWTFFSRFLFPLNVFFRFHSAALLFELTMRFQVKDLKIEDAVNTTKNQHDIYKNHFASY